jgi:hypothetical protein
VIVEAPNVDASKAALRLHGTSRQNLNREVIAVSRGNEAKP